MLVENFAQSSPCQYDQLPELSGTSIQSPLRRVAPSWFSGATIYTLMSF